MRKCKECGIIKEDSVFHSNGYQKNGNKKYKPVCGECYNIIRWRKHWERIGSIVGDVRCRKCGYDLNLSALEFHHKDKDKDIGISLCKTRSLKTLRREIGKCDLLCANCHRDEHNKDKRKTLIFK